MSMSAIFRYFKTSPQITRIAVMMYMRFPLSLRNIEDLLHERGIDTSHETVRVWESRFGQIFAAEIRRGRALPARRSALLSLLPWGYTRPPLRAVARGQGIVRLNLLRKLVAGWLSCLDAACGGPQKWDVLSSSIGIGMRSFEARVSSDSARQNSSWKDQP